MSNDIDETAAGGRKNPDNRIVDATSILTGGDALDLVSVDSGDRAKTYLIDLDLIAAAFSSGQTLGQLNFFGNSGSQGTDGRETLDLLKEIEATGDNTRDPDSFVDDGGSRQRLELFETNDAGEAVASDDLLALILAAIDAQADLEFFETETGFDIHIGGRWSTDILRFEGATAQQLAEDLLPPDNTAPDAMDDVITITAGETLADVLALILANDSDGDGDDLSVPFADVVFDPSFFALAGFSLEGFDGLVTDFEITAFEGVSGTTSFTYDVSDGNGGFDTATVTVIVEVPDPGTELLVDFGTYRANPGAGNSFDGDRLEIGNAAGVVTQDNNGFIVLDLNAIDVNREIAGIKIDATDVLVAGGSGFTSELSFFSYDSDGGDITALRSGVFDSFIFDDLSTGTEYATFEIGSGFSGDLSFDLQSDLLVQDLEQALADGDDLFALGLDGFADLPTSGFNTLLVSLANPFQSAITVEVVYEDQLL